jgi:hypothetical protein
MDFGMDFQLLFLVHPNLLSTLGYYLISFENNHFPIFSSQVQV